jgi:hypothetical protein
MERNGTKTQHHRIGKKLSFIPQSGARGLTAATVAIRPDLQRAAIPYRLRAAPLIVDVSSLPPRCTLRPAVRTLQ